MTLGARMTVARKRLGISQSELARRASLTAAAVWQIEHGDREPACATLRRLAPALGVSVDWLLGLDTKEDRCEPELSRAIAGIRDQCDQRQYWNALAWCLELQGMLMQRFEAVLRTAAEEP